MAVPNRPDVHQTFQRVSHPEYSSSIFVSESYET